MRRNWRILTVGLSVLIAAALAAPSASAGEAKFSDPAGDATSLVVAGVPRPSDPELDILEVSFSSNAKELIAVIKVEKIGTPAAATGATRAAGFTYEGAQYWFRFQAPQAPADLVVGSGFYFRKGADTIPCGRCSGRMDGKTNTVTFRAEWASMAAGMKSMDPGVTPIKPGQKIEGLSAETYRTVGVSALAADTATPPKPVEMTL